MEFSTHIFEKSHFNILKVMSLFKNELQMYKKFRKLAQIWLVDPYSKSPNSQMDSQNIKKIGIL